MMRQTSMHSVMSKSISKHGLGTVLRIYFLSERKDGHVGFVLSSYSKVYDLHKDGHDGFVLSSYSKVYDLHHDTLHCKVKGLLINETYLFQGIQQHSFGLLTA